MILLSKENTENCSLKGIEFFKYLLDTRVSFIE